MAKAIALIVTSQDSLATEKYADNGVHKQVHVVVKNQPFKMEVALTSKLCDGEVLDFNNLTLEGKLVYDGMENKQVDFVKISPMDYRVTANPTGDKATIELRLHVLSSQLEDMFFRIHLQARRLNGERELVNSLETLSFPIKVVSKPDQVVKKQTKTATKTPGGASGKPRASRKRPASELADSITTVEKLQHESMELIKQILHNQRQSLSATPSPSPSPSTHHNGFRDSSKKMVTDFFSQQQQISASAFNMSSSSSIPPFCFSSSNAVPFPAKSSPVKIGGGGGGSSNGPASMEDAFTSLIDSFHNIPAEERPLKVRRLIRSFGPKELQRVSEVFDMFWAQGLSQRGSSSTFSLTLSSSSTAIPTNLRRSSDALLLAPTCTRKHQLEAINSYYEDVGGIGPFL